MDARGAEFMRHLTGCQSQLYAYICSLTGNSIAAQNVLQEANLVLWDKAGDYDPSRPFLPWAYTFAYMQVLAWRKKRRRGSEFCSSSRISMARSAVPTIRSCCW